MKHRSRSICIAVFLLCTTTPACRPLVAEDDLDVDYAIDDRSGSEFWLTQAESEDTATATPQPLLTRSEAVAARRRRSSYRLPSMFGDYFGAGSLQATIQPISAPPLLVNIPFGGGAVRRVKVAENNSPIPRDRFIFNYNFFNDVIGGIGDVNRYGFGFEKTFFQESSSVEVMLPFASTLDANQIAGGTLAKGTQFGDLSIILKTILFEGDDCLIAGGVGLTAPLGDDARVFTPTGEQIINLQHESIHVQPYLGIVDSCESGWYWHGFLQLDVDASSTAVSADLTGVNLQPIGMLQDQTLLFLDFGVGYWLTNPELGTPAIVATAELHYATPLQDADIVSTSGLNITSATNRFDVVNLTLGASILANESFTVRPAMVIPLSGGDNDQFDFEAMVQMNFWR
jgi:hypothetical protein